VCSSDLIGSSNGVTYYNASNKYSNLTSSYDTSRISSILDNRSIREKYYAIHNNVGGNILSNILSTIFNSNSNVVSTALNTDNGIKTIPFGENSFKKIPKDISVENGQKVSEISVKDINLNVNGTLRLDSNGFAKDLDVSQLLNDTSFVSQLKELIKQSINNDINGGRFMNDNAVMRGMPAQTTLWGRK
jgi:LysM repeat protein